MASIPGGQYAFFATGQAVNVVTAPYGLNVPPPIPGDFNLELITSSGDPPGLPPGYQGVALESPDGRTIDLARGNYGVRVVDGGPHTIIAGTGNDSIQGGSGPDTIFGGSGHDLIVGGSGPDLIYAGTGGDTITAGSGPTTIYGGHGDPRGSDPFGGFGHGDPRGFDPFGGFGHGDPRGSDPFGGFGHGDPFGGHGQAGDLISGGGGPAVIYGGNGDTIQGGVGPDTIYGASHDLIS